MGKFMNGIKYLIMDVDGSLTDGKIYIGPNGEAMKAFSIKDGYAINSILKANDIVPIILTARNSSIVQKRCEELGIQEVYQGKWDKLTGLKEVVGEENLGCCSYFGDDIIDLQCMVAIKEAGGIVGCPADAVREIKAVVDYICLAKAGEGAFREFAEWLVKPRTNSDEIKRNVDLALSYLQHTNISEVDVEKKMFVNESFYYSVLNYKTKSEDEAELESHRQYVDIQMIVKGEELMDIADISRLTVKDNYNPKDDVIFWNIPERMARITLKAGDYIILYPENAHRGAIRTSEKNTEVLKIVGKVKINETV